MKRVYPKIGAIGLVMATALAQIACSSDGGDEAPGGTGGMGAPGTGGGTGTGTGATPGTGGGSNTLPPPVSCDDVVADGKVIIHDDTNFTFHSDLQVQQTTIKPHTDFTIDWSQVNVDFFGKSLNPITDINLVALSLWHQTPAELAANLNADNLPRSDVVAGITRYPDGTFTSANLLSFDSFGSEIPEERLWEHFDATLYPPAEYTYLIMAATGTEPGKNSRMLQMLKLDDAATSDQIVLTNDSTHMDVSVQLANIKQIPVPVGMPGIEVEWNEMVTTASGAAFDPYQITEAVVAHYADLDLAALEQQVLSFEELATDWYWGEVISGTSIILSDLKKADDTPFAGIDNSGVWLVMLMCTASCANPAPWSITVLKGCP